MPRFFAIPLVALVLVSPGCARRAAEDASDDTPAVTTRAPERKQLPVAPMPHRPGERIIATTVERVDEPDEKDLTTADLGLNPKIEAALPEIERLDKKSVEGVVTPDPVGLPIEDPPGVQPKLDPGGAEPLFAAFAGRSGATKSKLLKEGGGNEASEKAVALGLAWLAKQQQKDGSWAFDTG